MRSNNVMNQSYKKRLLRINDELIEEARVVIASKFDTDVTNTSTFVNLQLLHKWWGKVKSFGNQIDTAAKPWQEMLSKDPAGIHCDSRKLIGISIF